MIANNQTIIGHTEVKAYATGTYRKCDDQLMDYIADEVARYKDEGFSMVKLKSGFEVDENMASIAEVWKVIDPKMGSMLHANRGYDSVNAIRLAIAAEVFNIR